MATRKEIKVVLTADDNGFTIKTRQAADAVRGLKGSVDTGDAAIKRLESSYNSLWGKFHRGVTTLGTLRFALMDVNDIFLRFPMSVLRTSGEVERLTKLMEGLSTQSTDAARKLEAASNVKFLFNLAQNAPFEVKALGDAFVKLKTAGIDPTNGSLKILTDSIAKFGGGSSELHRAGIAIQQMAGKGNISMEELRQQLGEAIPSAMKAMAEGMGLTMAELQKKIKDGVVESTSALNKMFAVLGIENAGAAQAMMGTWVGLIERLKTQWTLFQLRIGQEGMFEGAKKELESLIDMLDGGSAEGLAVRIGRFLNDAMVTAVQFIKKVIELWDYVVLVGKAFAAWKFAQIVGAPIAATIAGVQSIAVKLREVHREELAQVAAKRKAILDNAQADENALRKWIANNQNKINAEKARMAESVRMQQADLAAKIRNNEAEIAAARTKAAQLLAIEQDTRVRARLMAIEADNLARQKKAGSAAAARGMTAGALDEVNAANQARSQANALNAQAAAAAAANAQMRQRLELLGKQTMVMPTVVANLERQNVSLRSAITANNAAAVAMAASTKAASMMGGALRAVGGALLSLLNPLNLVMAALMAGVWWWDQYAAKARKAAGQAKDAAELKDAIERGTVSKDKVDNSRAHLLTTEAKSVELLNKIQENNRKIQELDSQKAPLEDWMPSIVREQNMKTRAQARNRLLQENVKLEQERGQLMGKVKSLREDIDRGVKQVISKDAEIAAAEQLAKTDRDATAVLAQYNQQRQKINAEFAKAFKGKAPTEAQSLAKQKRLGEVDKQAYAAEARFWEERKAQFKEMGSKAASASAESQRYARLVEEAEERRLQALEKLQNLQAPNRETKGSGGGKGPKTPKTPEPASVETSALEQLIRREELGLVKARASMQNVASDLVDIETLREQAREQVETIMANEVVPTRGREANDPARVEHAVDLLTQRKVVDFARQEMSRLMPQLEQDSERLGQLMERLETGQFDKEGPTREDKLAVMLQRAIRLAPQARGELAQVLETVERLQDVADATDVAEYMIAQARKIRDERIALIEDPIQRAAAARQRELDDEEDAYDRKRAQAMAAGLDTARIDQQWAERRHQLVTKDTVGFEQEIADLRIATIVDARQRQFAEFQKETNDVRAKYEAQIALAIQYGEDITRLQNQMTEHLQLIAKKQQEAMKTPLEKLVDQWKDTDAAILDLQANVADSFVNMLTSGLGEGKLEIDKWLEQVLLDITNMKLKAALADPLNTIINGATEGLQNIGVLPAWRNQPPGDMVGTDTAEFQKLDRALGHSTDALMDMSDQGVAQAAQATAQSAVVENHASTATQFLTNALYEAASAAQAFASAAASSAGFDIGSALAPAVGAGWASAGTGFGTGSMFGNQDYGLFFANGGIMDPQLGRVPLRKYARGGIANRPQAAIFGEGDDAEAFVPLPDGRSIPVNLQGSGAPSVTVNVINQSGTQVQAQSGQPRFDGKQMVLDVVLTAMNQPGAFRDGMKGAMRG